MKRILISVAGVAVAAVASGGLLAGLAGSVHAAAPPPWEPDASSVGDLTFYNAAGAKITGGSTSDSPLAAYVEGSSALRSGDTKATLFGYLPVKGEQPTQWTGDQLSDSTTYPNSAAPSPLKTATLPVVTGADGDLTVAQLASGLPNLDTSSDGYAHIYQLRLVTSKPQEGVSTTYDSADIEITGTTWSVVYSQSPPKATKTTLSVSPATAAFHGAKATLHATVAPAAAKGKVEFFDGSKALKTVALVAGKATFATTALPDGTAKLKARYIPASSIYLTSTSTIHSLSVKAHPTAVSLRASKNSIKVGARLTLTIKVTPVVAGKVSIYDGSKRLGTVTVKKGKAAFSTSKLKVGSHHLTARFTPSNTQNDKASVSKAVTIKVST
jgi:hypothetical protein